MPEYHRHIRSFLEEKEPIYLCIHCNSFKPIDSFYRMRKSKTFYRDYWCKDCRKKYAISIKEYSKNGRYNRK